MSNEYIVRFDKIVEEGKHGPYLVIRHQDLKWVTVSIDNWDPGDRPKIPKRGVHLVVSKLTNTDSGWRAESARYYVPKQELSKIRK